MLLLEFNVILARVTFQGKFAKDRGAGFIVVYIDLDDSQGCCECGPFPGFYALLNGFNGVAQKPCPKFDRTN